LPALKSIPVADVLTVPVNVGLAIGAFKSMAVTLVAMPVALVAMFVTLVAMSVSFDAIFAVFVEIAVSLAVVKLAVVASKTALWA
jgi:hypothetical protein